MLFSYKAIDKEGQQVTGTYEAPDRSQVVTYLRAQRLTPLEIGAGVNTSLKDKLPRARPQAKDMSMFCDQFCALIRAGVTIIDALGLLTHQTTNRMLKEGIMGAAVGVNEGESLANAMNSTGVFDATLVSLVRAGEASGSLDKSLERMATQYKKDAEIAAAIKKAMMYPIIVLVVAVAVVIAMLVYIVPAFMKMFEDIGIEMPKITLAVVAASNWVQEHFLLLIIILVAVAGIFIAFFRSAIGKKCLSWAALNIPGVKEFTIKSNASKIARTLSTLLTAGMSVIEALDILESTLSNYYYKIAIKEVREEVLNGLPMSRRFVENKKLFPPMLSHMISVGEDTGDITAMLIRTADYYDLEVETATETMMSFVQPAIIVLLTGIVGVLIAAVLMPMVSMYGQLGDAL